MIPSRLWPRPLSLSHWSKGWKSKKYPESGPAILASCLKLKNPGLIDFLFNRRRSFRLILDSLMLHWMFPESEGRRGAPWDVHVYARMRPNQEVLSPPPTPSHFPLPRIMPRNILCPFVHSIGNFVWPKCLPPACTFHPLSQLFPHPLLEMSIALIKGKVHCALSEIGS